MLQCWKTDPNDRPPFTELMYNLIKHLESLSDYMDVSTFQPASSNLKDQGGLRNAGNCMIDSAS